MRPIPVVTPAQRTAIKHLLQDALELAEGCIQDPTASEYIKGNNRQIKTIILSCMLVLDSGSKWNADFLSAMLRIFQKGVKSVIRGDFDYNEFIAQIVDTVSELGDVLDYSELEQLIQNLIDLI